MIDEIIARLAGLEKRLANICRIAQVMAVDETTGRLDVTFEGHILKDIPFLTMRAGEDKTYWLPSVGELGMLTAPSGDLANAFFQPGIFYSGFPVPEMDATLVKRIFRDGMEEEIDTDAHNYKYTTGDSERFVDRNKVEDKKGTSVNKIDNTETKFERAAGAIKSLVGSNEVELSQILLNLIGAQLFPNGITNIISPTGTCFFAPTPSPASAPSPPSGSSPDSDGNVTKTPASEISGVKIKATSTVSLTLPAIPVTTPAGPGATTPGSYSATVTGTIKLEFPARAL